MGFLSDLYYSKYCPVDTPLLDQPAYKSASEAVQRARKDLRRIHPDLTTDELDDLDVLYTDLIIVHQEIAYQQGIEFCTRFLAEALLMPEFGK